MPEPTASLFADLTRKQAREALDYIDAHETGKGGFKRADLAHIGVPWPPPKGWRLALRRAAGEMPPRLCTLVADATRFGAALDELIALLPRLPKGVAQFLLRELRGLRTDDLAEGQGRFAPTADGFTVEIGAGRHLELLIAAARATEHIVAFHEGSSCSVTRAVDRGPAGTTQPVRTAPIVGRSASARK